MKYKEKLDELFSKLDKKNIVKLNSFSFVNNIYAKVENKNLTGSIKDRTALQMIYDADEEGLINENTVFVEATSGNTGISIAYIASYLGLKSLIIMPNSMSVERRNMINASGGDILLVDGGMKECEEKLHQLLKDNNCYLNLSQFNNMSNVKAHYLTTAKEIDNFKIKFDYIVAGIGTGGTISGIGQYFKEKNNSVKIVGVEPKESPLLTQGFASNHKIQGIGANFVPKTLLKDVIDLIIDVDSDKSIEMKNDIFIKEGINVGISSGASLLAALQLPTKGKIILVIFPDNGDRYCGIK